MTGSRLGLPTERARRDVALVRHFGTGMNIHVLGLTPSSEHKQASKHVNWSTCPTWLAPRGAGIVTTEDFSHSSFRKFSCRYAYQVRGGR